ncbi:MAG: hypothetical protein WC787_01450 [Patescibacteria group bacterium]|jgi:hypothetical protein
MKRASRLLIYPAAILGTGGLSILVAYLLINEIGYGVVAYWIVWQFVMLAIFVCGMLLSFVRKWDARVAWEGTCAIAALAGIWALPAYVLPVWAAIVLSSIVTLLAVRFHTLRNVASVIGSAGIAFVFASWLPIEAILAGLAALMVYDMVSGSHGHAVRSLVERTPERTFLPRLEISMDDGKVIIGVAELAVPAAVALSLVQINIWSAGIVLASAVAGALYAAFRPGTSIHTQVAAATTALSAIVILLLAYV